MNKEMYEMPVLNLELKGIQEHINYLIEDKNDELQKIIASEMEKHINEKWFKREISQQVKESLQKAIKGIADNYDFNNRLTRVISIEIGNLFLKMEKTKKEERRLLKEDL